MIYHNVWRLKLSCPLSLKTTEFAFVCSFFCKYYSY